LETGGNDRNEVDQVSMSIGMLTVDEVIKNQLAERILVLDGAMGTMVQAAI
jgi:hypothetical protein